MPKYYVTKTEFKIVPKEEIQRYLDAARDEDYKLAVGLVWLTGMRIQEAVNLKTRECTIDENERILEIRFKALKRGRIGTPNFSFDDALVGEIVVPRVREAYGRGDERILKRKSKSSYQKALLAMNQKVWGESKQDYLTFHQFRHSRVTYLIKLGATNDELIAWFGRKTSDFSDYTIAQRTARFRGFIK